MKKSIVLLILSMTIILFANYYNYFVQSGDTLYSISKETGIPISVLVDLNSGLNTNLRIGQDIKIPFTPGILFKPTKSLSITELARTFFIDVDELRAINYSIGNTVPAGKEVFVPLGTSITAFANMSDFIWPVYGKITSGFGWRLHPIYGKSMFHSGIDISAPTGTPVFASRAGTVKFAGWRTGYGNLVILSHGAYETYYAHLSKISVFVGLQVSKGDLIGRVGETGTATGPHLHFEVRIGGKEDNPVAYLPKTNTYVMRRVFSE